MKNVTVSVDDEILAAVSRYAAEQNSTVNALNDGQRYGHIRIVNPFS